TCVCASMSPGSKLVPGTASTGQPSGADRAMPVITRSSTSTTVPSAQAPARASNTRSPATARRELTEETGTVEAPITSTAITTAGGICWYGSYGSAQRPVCCPMGGDGHDGALHESRSAGLGLEQAPMLDVC